MKGKGLKSLDEITPEEFARLERLAQRRGPGAEANSLVLGVGLFTLLGLAVGGYFFMPEELEISLVSMAVFLGGLWVFLMVAWWMVYRVTEQPRDMARKQLEHLREELKGREATEGLRQ